MTRGNLTRWGLTARMVQILDALAAGKSHEKIGEELGVSRRTVEATLRVIRDRIEDVDGVRPSAKVQLLVLWLKNRTTAAV